MSQQLYLKSTVIFEPLICNWYAWPYLVSPLTLGFFIKNKFLHIMKSYLAAPEIHEQAQKTKSMLGGPFINIDSKYWRRIEELINELETDYKDMMALADNISSLESLLHSQSDGCSLESKYSQLPPGIKGMVELTYDQKNQIMIRYFEKLFYQTYYSPEKTQKGYFSLSSCDSRPFSLSTPRIGDENSLFISKNFSHPIYDKMFSARISPINPNEIADELQLNTEQKIQFERYFTKNPPHIFPYQNHEKNKLHIRYFGHACVLLQTNNISVLLDPLISYQSDNDLNRFTYNDLPDFIDYVLLTHNHQDHVSLETLIQLRHKIGTIVVPANNKGSLLDPSLKLVLQNLGFNSVIELNTFDNIQLNEGEIISLPFLGEHGDLCIQSKTIYYLRLLKHTFLFAVDANNIDNDLFNYIRKMIPKLDYLFIGMECKGAPLSWLYGPIMQVQLTKEQNHSRRLSGSDSDKAWEIVKILQPKSAYIYAMGQEPWLNYLMALDHQNGSSPQMIESEKFISKCKEHGIVSERLYLTKEWDIA